MACLVAAMNLLPVDTYLYPSEVEWQIDQQILEEFSRLALTFNKNPKIEGVLIQHEYGIFSGKEGENILTFMEACHKPILLTLHTVLPAPSPRMKMVTERMIRRAQIVVVLTESSKVILETLYPESINKLHVIPHGIHETSFSGSTDAKIKLKLENRTVLSTFGLLNRGKGIEYVLRALPSLITKHPKLIYLILGETHPVVRRQEGESYRQELIKLVSWLKLTKQVKFYDQFFSLTDLVEFLKATDIYISPSINLNQAVSGTLSYAMGTGRAVISTAFAQAKEIITPETGRLVPIKKPAAITQALDELLSNPVTLEKMHREAYRITRPMLWSNVAKQYSMLLKQYILPKVNLKHLSAMTDDYGLYQFAKLDKPNKHYGYTLDDNARALVICCWLVNSDNKDVEILMKTYLQFIQKCQQSDGKFVNYIDHAHKQASGQNAQEDLEDPTARAMWALSEVIKNELVSSEVRETAKKLFELGLPKVKKLYHVRANALMIKAYANVYNDKLSNSKQIKKAMEEKAEGLIGQLDKNSLNSWQWFENFLGYNNAIIPEALLIAGKIIGKPIYTDKGNTALNFLVQKTFSLNRYRPIGHAKWYKNKEKRSDFDQQPEDPASMILALTTAYNLTHQESYRHLTEICFSWFLGNNSLQLPLYNESSGGCYDGLHPDRVNLNQGAESLVSYLLSRLAVGRIAQHENPRN